MADRKKFQGVIRLREKGKVAVRGKILAGLMTAPQMAALARIAEEFGDGTIGLTTRLNVEFPNIDRRDAQAVAERLREAGIEPGSTGAALRSVVACKGTTCRHGCCDTQGLARAIEERYGAYDTASGSATVAARARRPVAKEPSGSSTARPTTPKKPALDAAIA